jgi:acyl carrier protein
MEDRVYDIVASVLRVPRATLSPASSPDSIPTWDSLQHLQLTLALEEAFSLQFEVHELEAMHTVQAIVSIVRERMIHSSQSAPSA